MNVLVGCEESQVVSSTFRSAGHDAYSCDLVKTRGNQSYHLQCDVIVAINDRPWDLIILHPDCTAMALSDNRWYGEGMPMHSKRLAQVEWTMKLWEAAKKVCDKVALENPASVIFPKLRRMGATVQYIQPWMFGHGETKKTGLALHGVPELKPTNIVDGREQRVWRMAPGKNRKRDRSETYLGIAKAMSEQWVN